MLPSGWLVAPLAGGFAFQLADDADVLRGIAQAERSSPGAMRKGMTGQDTPWKASTSSLGSSSLGSDGVPPPPAPMTCVRHRGGRGWSLLDPCEECLQIAMEADLGVA